MDVSLKKKRQNWIGLSYKNWIMPLGAVKENVGYPCQGHQNGQRIRLGFLAEAVRM